MKFNRIFALSLAAALALTLASCGKKNDEPTPAPTDSPAVSESVKPSDTPVPSAEPTVEPSAEPSVEPEPSQPVQSMPIETPPAESAGATELSAEDVWNTVSAGRELPSFMDLDDGLLSDLYGIDATDLDNFVAKIPMMNVHATEFFIAKVKSGKMDTVKAGIAKRQADLEEQWSSYLPEQLELVQNYKLAESGDYVLFAIYEDADDIVKAFEDCTK